MIYLASPYSHPDEAVREGRYRAACAATVRLLRAGKSVFSPIVLTHGLVAYGLPTDWSFWESYDRDHLERCDDLVVLTIDGWDQSVGVAAEIALASSLGKPIRYLAPRPPTLAPVTTDPELGLISPHP